MNTPKWISEKPVSKIVDVKVQTLRNWRFRGEGPPYSKVNRSVRYKLEDVLNFMESKKVVPRDEK
jgi:hypothetical protein